MDKHAKTPEWTKFEVKVATDLLDNIEKLTRENLGQRFMSIPPEMALILIAAYREYLRARLPSGDPERSALLKVEEALRSCRTRFAEYAASHAAKGADLKARRNQDMVDDIDYALSQLEEARNGK